MIDRRALMAGGLAAAALPLAKLSAQWEHRGSTFALPDVLERGAEDSCEVLAYEGAALDVGRLCNEVSEQLQAGGADAFNYRVRLYTHSSANPRRDPPSHLARKIQHLWIANSQQLACNLVGFSVRRGNIMKLAVEKNAREFLNDTLRRWRVGMNDRDATGETPLDYIAAEMARARGTSNEAVLQRYHELFVRAGAKRASQLTPADRPVDPYDTELRPLLRGWERACYFNEGLAAVKRGGLWGYVNASGQVVVPPRYDGAFAFSQGRAAVHRGERWGYIDTTGNEVIPLQFADARVFANGSAEVTRDGRTWSRISLAGAAV